MASAAAQAPQRPEPSVPGDLRTLQALRSFTSELQTAELKNNRPAVVVQTFDDVRSEMTSIGFYRIRKPGPRLTWVWMAKRWEVRGGRSSIAYAHVDRCPGLERSLVLVEELPPPRPFLPNVPDGVVDEREIPESGWGNQLVTVHYNLAAYQGDKVGATMTASGRHPALVSALAFSITANMERCWELDEPSV